MSDKKNEIIEEQRKAREEFLKLKKMQKGEMKAPPKPSEVAIIPKTPKEKLENFWYQYKWHTIAVACLIVVLSIIITQCATKINYDMKIVYFTYTPVMDVQTDSAATYFEEMIDDINGDGEVNIQIVNCSISDQSTNAQYRNTILTKLQSVIVSDQTALLFITDEKSINYFNGIGGEEGLFEGKPISLKEEFYDYLKADEFGEIEQNLQISCRRINGTVLEDNQETAVVYEQVQKIIEKVS